MTDRRDFIKALGAAALAPALQPLAPSLHSRASLRKLDRIGLQLYTVRHAMEKDVEGTIARVAAIGYREVEFAGYFGKSARCARRRPRDRAPLSRTRVDPGGRAAHARRLQTLGGAPQPCRDRGQGRGAAV